MGAAMKYVSTRGAAPERGFEDVLLAGLASDGGLYVPDEWPSFSSGRIKSLAGLSYEEMALEVIEPFIGGEIERGELAEMISMAYRGFSHRAIAPMVQLDANDWLLELFHGPTLAFKDFAMQLLARLMDRALAARGRKATIVGATSGDTGGAAIEAFRGRDNIDIFILHPHNRVTAVQRRQMTTPTEENVHNIAIEGNFDDCQALLKSLFNDGELRDKLQLAGVNSINWARIVGQIPYYFFSAIALGGPEREVAFSVPSGNMGDIFAGFVARRMGLPISRLIIATNVNDILARALESGVYESGEAIATDSPSMDIQVSSNFERLLYELSNHDAGWIEEIMKEFSQSGKCRLRDDAWERFKSLFAAHRLDDEETEREIARVRAECGGYVIDPHSAVGVGVGRHARARGVIDADIPLVCLATAHPAKFPDAVRRAIGEEPAQPEQIIAQKELPERFDILPNDFDVLAEHIAGLSRVT
jgi:threonine synthase